MRVCAFGFVCVCVCGGGGVPLSVYKISFLPSLRTCKTHGARCFSVDFGGCIVAMANQNHPSFIYWWSPRYGQISSTDGALVRPKGKWTDKHKHCNKTTTTKHKSGSEWVLRFWHSISLQGKCLTHPEPHSVTPSPERRVGAGRDDGADSGMKEEKSKPKIIN